MNRGNIYENIPQDLPSELLEPLISNGDLKIERIVSKGHKSPDHGWYDQEFNEWVILLKGAARLEFEEGELIKLGEGDFVNIPAHCKHKVAWTTPLEHTVWLAIHYP